MYQRNRLTILVVPVTPHDPMSTNGMPINVDVIVPVHNAEETVKETVHSALNQWIPRRLLTGSDSTLSNVDIDVAVCCHDDGSTDDSLRILKEIKACHEQQSTATNGNPGTSNSNDTTERSQDGAVPGGRRIRTRLLIGSNADGVARGAGFARNRAAKLRSRSKDGDNSATTSFMCLLDSDDIMHHSRIAEQLNVMLSIPQDDAGGTRDRTLLGCTFDRKPAGSTWHYSEWANGLTDERLFLERYREVTLLQPTWFLTRSRFEQLGGYVEAPHPNHQDSMKNERLEETDAKIDAPSERYRLIHPIHDNAHTLRLAEDLRFFHEHLRASGLLKLYRHGPSDEPLVTYRHRAGQSQSSSTPRKLLLNLRVMAFKDNVLRVDPRWADGFVIWGAGRDGKDFFKSLSPDIRARVRCFADVDEKKITAGFYANADLGAKVPIVHFSLLAADPNVRNDHAGADADADADLSFGRISKKRKKVGDVDVAVDTIGNGNGDSCGVLAGKRARTETAFDNATEEDTTARRPKKRQRKLHNLGPKEKKKLDIESLPGLPVVVCVAMYRTNGVLESNVRSIGRVEGETLWHFS